MRQGKVLAFILGLVGGAGVIALLVAVDEWRHRPRCPSCGRRMRPA
jgi:hypothetical protein